MAVVVKLLDRLVSRERLDREHLRSLDDLVGAARLRAGVVSMAVCIDDRRRKRCEKEGNEEPGGNGSVPTPTHGVSTPNCVLSPRHETRMACTKRSYLGSLAERST